jgi:hypothetical protein
LRFYNLKDYEDTKFATSEQILSEAMKNKKEAQSLDDEAVASKKKRMKTTDEGKTLKPEDPKLVGGIYFNPIPIREINKDLDGAGSFNVASSMFKVKKDEQGIKDEQKEKENNEEMENE